MTTPYTRAQADAIACLDKPLQIIACAGSGKTQVISQRIAKILAQPGVRPRNIVAFTFTEKAAAELKERVISIVQKELGELPGMAEMCNSIGEFSKCTRPIILRMSFDEAITSNSKLRFAFVVNKLCSEVFCIFAYMQCKSLANRQPNIVRSKNEGYVILKCHVYRMEEAVWMSIL